MLGESIGNFRIVARLGAGGMGEVFLAEQAKIGTKVAIKMLRAELSADKAHVDRFFNEALAVSKIKHAGIVRIFDVGFHERGSAYLVMEFLEGEALASRIARVGRLPLAQICDIGRQIANILDATHAAGITHRDLKPDNIFLVADAELASRERVKILDFGIAKLTGTMAGSSPKTMGVMGTPGYMAPEQWGDSSKVDWRADVYSLGCLAFEMAGGRQPFPAQTFPESYAKHLNEPPPHVRTLAPELPEALDALLIEMLAKQPAERPAMADIASRFEAIGKGAPVATARGVPAFDPGTAPTVHTITPVVPATPPIAPAPPPVTPAIPPPVTPNTTLGASAGESAATPTSKRGLWLGLGALGATGAIVGVVVTRDGSPAATERPPGDAAALVVADAATPVPEPKPVAETLRHRVEQANPFVEIHGTKLQTRQISNQEYGWYLASLGADATVARPLSESWSADASPGEPVAWVTFERARRFCEAIDASLPTAEQWLRAAGGKSAWGIDPASTGRWGPLQEWTATVHDGLAIVHGAYLGMPNEDMRLVLDGPMQKPTESLAGVDDPAIVASAKIGFRCAR